MQTKHLTAAKTSFVAAFALGLVVACAPGDDAQDLGDVGGGKADFIEIRDLPVYVPHNTMEYLTFRATGAFRISIAQPDKPEEQQAWLRLRVSDSQETVFEEHETSYHAPVLVVRPGDEAKHDYTLRVWNRSNTKNLDGLLTIEQGSGGATDPDKLQYKSYDLLFTNPICRSYEYASPIPTADGQGTRTGKAKNVYCGYDDVEASGSRATSPQHRLVEWISPLEDGDELFLAYLSYSNWTVADALCDAARRGVKVTFVLDGPTDRSRELEECGGTVLFRGHEGGVGYAHNKILMVNPNGAGPGDPDPDYMRLVFSSGNMSSGAVLHHENWHFIEVKRESYFAQAHRCLMQAQIDEIASSSKAEYKSFLNRCRGEIPYPEEEDIKAFFIPNSDDSSAATRYLVEGIERAQRISMGAHRFSYTTMIDALADRLRDDDSVQVRLVADDDLYWLKPYGGGPGHQPGDNMEFEADNVSRLYAAGGDGARFQVKYMETNHGSHLLHHNKYLLFEDMPDRPDAVLCGAANLTGTGFWENFENIYYVEVPAVVDSFKTQYARFWDGIPGPGDEQAPPQATAPEDMPATDISL